MMQTFWVICILHIFVITGCSSQNTNITSSKELDGTDEYLHYCTLIEVGPEDYELLPNGSVRLGKHNLTPDKPFYVLGNGTLSSCSISSSENTSTILLKILEGKDESLHGCSYIELDPEIYELLPNDSVRLREHNLTLDDPFYVLRNGTLSSCSFSSSENTYDTLPDFLKGKDESLLECKSIPLKPEEYVLLPNDSLHLILPDVILDEPFYVILNEAPYICLSILENSYVKKEGLSWTSYITLVGLVISMLSLFLHLVAFCLVPDLRNLPGWNLASLCGCLFVSYLLILVLSDDVVLKCRIACVALGSTRHFFLLAAFIWMSIMSFDVFASLLRATGRFRRSSTNFSRRKFGLSCLCSYGIALLFSVFGALADALEFVPEILIPKFEKRCWFSQKYSLVLFFAGPVLLLTCLNFLLFGASAYIIHSNKRKSDQDAQQPALKRRYLMYFRLSVIMGTSWIVSIVANVVNDDWMWFVFVILNALQGLFIFLAFTWCKKVKKYFREKIAGSRRSSEQTLTSPTFQSYCHSIEKDLVKTVVKENVAPS